MKGIEKVWARAWAALIVAALVCLSTPALAGTSSGGGQIAQDVAGGLQWILDLITSPALTIFAAIMMAMAIAGAYFSNMGEGFKGALKVAAVTCGIIMSGSIMTQVVNAAGATF